MKILMASGQTSSGHTKMKDDLVGKAHARETQNEFHKLEIVEQFMRSGSVFVGNAIAAELFHALVFREMDPSDVRQQLMEML